MPRAYTEDIHFKQKNFASIHLQKGEYDHCIFDRCNFSNVNLADVKFIDCVFNDCNLSLARLTGTTLIHATFKNCKMLGLHFEDCNNLGLSFSFEGCQLDHSSFYKIDIRKTRFVNSRFHEADFTACNLTEAQFDNCDFANAIFDRTILEKADLRTSWNVYLDPEMNRIKKARFSVNGLAGLLGKYDLDIT